MIRRWRADRHTSVALPITAYRRLCVEQLANACVAKDVAIKRLRAKLFNERSLELEPWNLVGDRLSDEMRIWMNDVWMNEWKFECHYEWISKQMFLLLLEALLQGRLVSFIFLWLYFTNVRKDRTRVFIVLRTDFFFDCSLVAVMIALLTL